MKKLLFSLCFFTAMAFPIANSAANTSSTNDTAIEKIDAKSARNALSLLVTVDKNEITVSKLATKKSMNAEVKKYAEMMIKDHTHNLEQVKNLSRKLKLTLAPTLESLALKKDGVKELASLTTLSGKEFDNAYMTAMVKDHSEVLSKLDGLIAKEENAELKNFLTSTRETVKQHLKQAENIKINS